jgi:hypothetical protein
MAGLAEAREERKRLVARMAADLVRCGTYGEKRAAMGTLSGLGYAMGDIVVMIDDARALATQEAVAAAMATP